MSNVSANNANVEVPTTQEVIMYKKVLAELNKSYQNGHFVQKYGINQCEPKSQNEIDNRIPQSWFHDEMKMTVTRYLKDNQMNQVAFVRILCLVQDAANCGRLLNLVLEGQKPLPAGATQSQISAREDVKATAAALDSVWRFYNEESDAAGLGAEDENSDHEICELVAVRHKDELLTLEQARERTSMPDAVAIDITKGHAAPTTRVMTVVARQEGLSDKVAKNLIFLMVVFIALILVAILINFVLEWSQKNIDSIAGGN